MGPRSDAPRPLPLTQVQHWNLEARKFRFGSLPYKIRLMVYEFAFPAPDPDRIGVLNLVHPPAFSLAFPDSPNESLEAFIRIQSPWRLSIIAHTCMGDQPNTPAPTPRSTRRILRFLRMRHIYGLPRSADCLTDTSHNPERVRGLFENECILETLKRTGCDIRLSSLTVTAQVSCSHTPVFRRR